MGWFSGRSELQDKKTICDVIADIASFVQPEITQYERDMQVVRFWITPGVVAVVLKAGGRWYLREINLDENGQPSALQWSPDPVPLSEPAGDARQVAMMAVHYLTGRWSATLNEPDSSESDRKFSQRALSAVEQRMEAGPPTA